jgi:hypothetical protein
MRDEFERKQDFARRDLINSKITETNTHALPFNPASNKRMLSFEYPF